MTKTFKAMITAKGDTAPEARNKILRVLAQAELKGEITHFILYHEEAFPQ